MPRISVRIPQMGEGLQEARLVQFLKRPGDSVRRDEPIYVMETDKAITEVESPYAGSLVAWLVEADSVLPIGTEIAQMDVPEEIDGREDLPHRQGHAGALRVAQPASEGNHAGGNQGGRPLESPGRGAARGNLGVPIPPRTRKYLREKGLLAVAGQIPAAGKKLLPEDVDQFLAGAPAPGDAPLEPAVRYQPSPSADFVDRPLPKTQQTLNFRMKRGMEACIPAVIAMDMEWGRLATARERQRAVSQETAFSMFVWCVVQAMTRHAALRSSISGDGKSIRTFQHVHIGVAVAVEEGLLRTAVVRDADRLNRASFADGLRSQIQRVRAGEDQIDASTTVTVSNIGAHGIRAGIPVIVTPAVATLALGQVRMYPFPLEGNGFQFRPVATVTMSFDHRVLNGVGAAEFLQEVQRLVETFE